MSPIIAGRALKGPADRILAELGHEPSVVGVARMWAPYAATLVVDTADADLADAVEAEGMRCVVTPTVMAGPAEAAALARAVLGARLGPRAARADDIELIPVEGIAEIPPGDDLADVDRRATPSLADGDVVVVTQKIVSKAEGRMVAIDPDDPPSHKRLVLGEAVRVLRRRGDLTA